MVKPLLSLITLLLLVSANTILIAQNTVSTQLIATPSLCPGSTFTVPFTRTGAYANSNTFTVQLSDGGDYKNIETGPVSLNSTTNVYSVVATIPQNQAAGTTYTVRVIASDPAVIGTPSVSKLTIKTRPAPPAVTPQVVDCQKADGSNNVTVLISVTATAANATTKLYNADGSAADFLNRTGDGQSFIVFKNNATYLVAQQVDGCESDRKEVKVIIKPKANVNVSPLNTYGVDGQNGPYGRIAYCQNSKAISIKEYGIQPLPDNITVEYRVEPGGIVFEGYPPTPKTDQVGQGIVSFRTLLDGCPSTLYPYGRLTVTVNPVPVKPTVSSNVISLCQFQQASPLAALPANGATLVWYGTSATGGTGSAAASQPSTNTAGIFKYYVAQRQNDCESERAEITVEVKGASPAPVVSDVSYCQAAPASQLSAVAASGGSLLWYTASSGGVGSPGGPVPSTSSVGVQTFYVSQLIGTSCESQRIPLRVTTNALPPAPSLSRTTVTFCQSAQGEPLTATGQNLKWYEVATGGTGIGSITPSTASAGTKSYYVSQTVNGCEGPRSSVTVDILAAPAAPTVAQSTYEFCQGTANATISGTISPASQTGWYIYGDEPGLLNFYTSGNTAYAVVPTTQARSLIYSLFQTAPNGCKGPPSQQINITIKPTPVTPTVQSVAVCQNAPAPTLQVSGQNLLWYTASTGGIGSATTPTINTAQTSQITYYVSQTGNGCESPRAALPVTVNAIPGVPTVEATGPAYCQNATATSLSATGQGLKWYRESSGGISLGDKLTPETKEVGSFTYYVSQTINGCEGARSSITVRVTAAPSPPSVTNSYSYCQKSPSTELAATGNSLKWYDESNKLIGTPTPSTDNPGTATYFVTQSAGNCESPRAEIKVVVKPTPGAPTPFAVSACQNDTSRTLSANGQSLLWYTAETGGTGSSTAPRITTGQPIQTNYYVSQRIDGCEGPRAVLPVLVKPSPTAPGVASKEICQFSKAEPLTAQGNNLQWYYPDGKLVGAVPTPPTDRGASYAYQVSQVADGCEGPKATLTVTILTTPPPTVTRSTVEVCLGSTPQPLQATGNNLKWTDPAGNVTTTTPTPPTLNATLKPEGDIFYVTQTGANGCESPRVAISVFVQTPPTMSILGSTTTNLGLEVPLKLTFTGVGPYRYKLSDGSSGTTLKDTVIMVLPTRSSTYQVIEVSNKCGVGLPGIDATAVVTVNVPTIQTLAFTSTTLCAGTNLAANFITSGVFNAGSAFKLQYARVESDTTKISFVDVLNNQTSNGAITGVLPENVPAGLYLVRVIATNPKIPILGTISPTRLTVRSKATGSLTGTQSIYEGQSAKLSVAFTGDGPWDFSYRDSTASGLGTIQSISTNTNPHVLEVRPIRTTAYILTSISNGCGLVRPVTNTIVVNVAPLLGIEDQSLADAVDIYPVPVTTTLTVRIRGLTTKQPAILELVDMTGRVALRQETKREMSILSLEQVSAGIYIMHIKVGDRMTSKRIVKL